MSFRVRRASHLALVSCGLAGCGHPSSGSSDAAQMIDAAIDAPVDTPDASPFDGPPGVPDLQLVPSRMINTAIVTLDWFDAGDCAVVEGCVGAAGQRLLLRFNTVTANLGTGDIALGKPPADGISDATFQWSACHKHHHIPSFVHYELIDSAGHVTAAQKQSFCLQDSIPIVLDGSQPKYTCANQGIQRGWADQYTRGLPCQWIDITGMTPGTYSLHVAVNPEHRIPESDDTNNELQFDVTF